MVSEEHSGFDNCKAEEVWNYQDSGFFFQCWQKQGKKVLIQSDAQETNGNWNRAAEMGKPVEGQAMAVALQSALYGRVTRQKPLWVNDLWQLTGGLQNGI